MQNSTVLRVVFSEIGSQNSVSTTYRPRLASISNTMLILLGVLLAQFSSYFLKKISYILKIE